MEGQDRRRKARRRSRSRSRRRWLWLPAAVLVLALAIGIFCWIHGSPPAVQEAPVSPVQPDETAVALAAKYAGGSDRDRQYMQRLESVYPRGPEILRILLHIEEYPDSLLDVLLLKTELLPFVAAYPDSAPVGLNHWGDIDVSADYTPGEFPLFLQWDSRWGYEIYGSDCMALTACGPTCFAMAYVGLTGDTSMNPMKAAKFALDNGYYSYGAGTYNALFLAGASAFGMSGRLITNNLPTVRQALEAGQVVIANMGPGDFTYQGHYILLTGLNPDGTVRLNDPNSRINSSHAWDLATVVSQTKFCDALSLR